MNLPTKEEIEKLWDEYHVPANVRMHSEQVARVAVFLAKKLSEKGENINVELVEKATLLHDLTRSANFENFDIQEDASEEDIEVWKKLKQKYGNIDHADSAADLVKDKYPEVADVIRAHSISIKFEDISQLSWEQKILTYSDVRVLHDKIVSIKERFEDSKKRHEWFYEQLKKKTGIDYREKIKENTRKIEKQIFAIIDIKPEEINNL